MRLFARMLIALLCAGGAAFAADTKVEITPKPDYSQGAVFRSVAETKIDQTLVLGGMNVPTNVETYAATRDTVVEPDSDGKARLQGEFEYFIINIDTPIGKYAFDSNKSGETPNTPAPFLPYDKLFRATADSKWTATLNAEQEYESLEFEGSPFDDVPDAVKGEISPERMQHEHNMALQRYPDGPVAQGDTWQRSEEIKIGNGQWMKFDKEFEYLGSEERSGKTVDKIGVRSLSVKYGIGENSQLPITLEKSELEIAESEGLMIYDRGLGMIVETAEKVKITGDLEFKLDINGQQQKLPGALDLTFDTKVKSERQAN